MHAREDLIERRGGHLREKRPGEHLVVTDGISPEQPGDVGGPALNRLQVGGDRCRDAVGPRVRF